MPPDEGKSASLLFRVSIPICALVAVLGIMWPKSLAGAVSTFTGTAFKALDWFFMLSISGMLILCLCLAFSRFGKIKLGKEGDEPEFSTISWLAMLFAAGMGAGLLFWGVAEPMMHYSAPPIEQPGSAEAARMSMVITNFHWGLHAWAVYCFGALVLAYFHFKHGAPYLSGEPLRTAFEGRWVAPVAWAADLIAVLAVAFGVAGSLAMGVFQLNAGLHAVAGVPAQSTTVAIALLVVLFFSYMTSAATSLDKGIKWLSNINMTLAIGLLIFLLLAGPTSFILSTLVGAMSDYVNNLVVMSLQLHPHRDMGGWMRSWTLVYFIWWIAWTPFVGIFIARISRGRTIREFVLGVLLAPTLFSMIWFAIFGGIAIKEDKLGGGDIAQIVNEDVTQALFTLYERLPLTPVLSILSLILIFIFVVTSVDSATFVLGMLTSKGSLNPPVRRKLAWGLLLSGVGAAFIITNNIDAVRAAAISGAIPFTLVLLLQAAALIKVLRHDDAAKPEEKSDEGGEP